MTQQYFPQLSRTVELDAVGQHSRGINGAAGLADGSPFAYAVEIFECETQRVHLSVTNRTGGVRTVLLHPLAHRQNFAFALGILIQGRHIRRRRRWGRAEQILQNPFAADNG